MLMLDPPALTAVWLRETLHPSMLGCKTPPAYLEMKFVHQRHVLYRDEKKSLDCCGFLYSVYSFLADAWELGIIES